MLTDKVDPWSSAVQAQNAGHHEYHRRARAVFWRRGHGEPTEENACKVGGPHNAKCMLRPDHRGDHYGPGFDDWGPKGPYTWENKS